MVNMVTNTDTKDFRDAELLDKIIKAESLLDIGPRETYERQMEYVDSLARHAHFVAVLKVRHPNNYQEMLNAYRENYDRNNYDRNYDR